MTTLLSRSVFPLLALLTLLPAIGRADMAEPKAKLLGPQHPTQDFYRIGKERVKLKAFLVEATAVRDIKDAVEHFRKTKGTHNWEWKIGYIDFSPKSKETLVLAWYNLDSNETGWQAATRDESGLWLKMSDKTEKWSEFRAKNENRRDTTNGFSVVMRISKANQLRLAYAFSKKE